MANATLNKPDQYDDTDALKGAEESLKGSAFDTQSQGFNEQFANQDKNAASPEAIESSEQAGDSGLAPNINGTPKKQKITLKSAGNFVKRNRRKFMIIGAGGGVVGVLVAIGLQFLTLLPATLQNNITQDRFKHIGRLIANNNSIIVKLKMMLDSTSDAEYARALNEYRAGEPGGSLFAKLNQLRPVKIAENLLLDSEFEYKTTTLNVLGVSTTREKIVSATIDGTTIPVPENSYGVVGRTKHPINWGRDVFAARANSRTVVNGFIDQRGIRLPWGMRFVVVSAAAKAYRASINAQQWRWTKAEVDEADKDPPTPQEAVSDAYETSYERNKETRPQPTEETAKQIQTETDSCVEDAGCRNSMINDGSVISSQTEETINTAFDPTFMRNLIGHLSTAQAWAALTCAIAETSVQASEAVMAAYMAGAATMFTQLAAAPDQQVYTQYNGDDKRVNAALTGGYEGQINAGGTAGNSVPMRRAAGQAFTTAATFSPAASAIGMFGTNPTGFLGAGAASAIDGNTCAVLQHWSTGVILAALELGFTFTGGGAAAKAAGTTVTNRLISTLSEVVRSQFSRGSLAINAGLIGTEQVANVLTAMSQANALQQAGALYNGMAGGEMYINQADAGATVLAQAATQQYGGAPMTTDAYLETTQEDKEYTQIAMGEQSLSERYFAITTPGSLANNLAVSIGSNLNFQSIGSVFQSLANLFNPASIMANLSASVKAEPGDNPDIVIQEREYGIPQIGFTNDEEAAFTGNEDYSPLYNEQILDSSGQREDLMDKYGKCFDPVDTPMSELLANGDIARDENANVIADEGDCAPYNLGDNEPNDGRLTFKDEEAEMVFRLRISIRVNRAVDDLLGIQDPETEEFASSGGSVNAEGYAFPMDPGTQRDYVTLPCGPEHNNVTNTVSGVSTCHHDGSPAFDLFFGSEESMGGRDVYAIYDAKVVRVNNSYGGVSGCYSITLEAKDDYYYWYGHLQNATVNEGDDVTAGQKIAEVAALSLGSGCWQGTPHLHIDRAENREGAGRDCCRDPQFVPLMNSIWSGLPPE